MAPDQPIVLEYTLTLDDVEEASRPLRPDGTPATKRAWWSGVLGWLLFMACLVGFCVMRLAHPPASVGSSGSLAPEYPPQNLWVVLFPTAIPALMVAIYTIVSTLKRLRSKSVENQPGNTTGRARRLKASIIVWAVIGGISAVIWLAPTVIWHPDTATATVVGFLPWMGLVLVIILLSNLTTRAKARTMWLHNPALALKQEARADDRGLMTRDELAECRFNWAYFNRFQEHRSLFVLHHHQKIHIIPKRAFDALPDGALQIDRFRGLLQNHVREGKFLPKPSGFAVMPGVPEPPLAQLAPQESGGQARP